MNPLLTFNFTSTKPTTASGCQILPDRFKPVNVMTYRGPSKIPHLLIHSGYSCIPWKQSELSFGSRTRLMLCSYVKLAEQTHAEQILIHAPRNQNEMDGFYNGLMLLRKVAESIKRKGLKTKLCIENVYCTIHKTREENIKMTTEIFEFVIKNGFDIVIDTSFKYSSSFDFFVLEKTLEMYPVLTVLSFSSVKTALDKKSEKE